APFMSCSARLPVYALLIGTFFAQYSALARGGIMLGCYALGIVAAVITAWIFKRSFLKGPAQAFILELPTYKLPQLSHIRRPAWTPLVATSLLVWFVLAMQCMSTLAIVRRETGGWRWPLIMLIYMNALAYVASLAVFQLGSLFLKA